MLALLCAVMCRYSVKATSRIESDIVQHLTLQQLRLLRDEMRNEAPCVVGQKNMLI